MKQAMTLITALVLLLAGTNLQTPQVLAQDDAQKMIPMRERVQIMQRFWEQKKETVLPIVMRAGLVVEYVGVVVVAMGTMIMVGKRESLIKN